MRKASPILFLSVITALSFADVPANDDALTAYYRGDYKTALKLLGPMADEGNTFAQFTIGKMYVNGEGTKKDVKKGFVAYIRGGNQLLEVPVTEKEVSEVNAMIDEIFTIITTGKLPKRTPYRNRCADCCYKNICV